MPKIKPGKVLFALLFLILILLMLNIGSYLFLYMDDGHPKDFFFRKTNFNMEKNLPTIFSGILHFSAFLLLLQIGLSKVKVLKQRTFWFFLSFLFLYTGLDEILRIHEKVGKALSGSFEFSGLFLFSWVIPYGIALCVIIIFLFKPFFSLDRTTIKNFMISGAIFLSGAIGLEMFTGWYIEYNNFDLTQLLIIPEVFVLSTVEELLEMTGLSYFIYSLLLFKIKHNL